MTDAPQPPEAAPPPPPPPSVPPSGPGYYVTPVGRPPESIGGVFYSIGLTILLTIVTLGIWTFLWTYRTSEDLKRYNGDGLGGVLDIVILFVFSPVLMFTIPNEIKNAYQHAGRESPISAIWGLWILLPIIGWIVWYVKVQRSLNQFWLSAGSRPD
jgi:Domain of unknown function (DUF4234)